MAGTNADPELLGSLVTRQPAGHNRSNHPLAKVHRIRLALFHAGLLPSQHGESEKHQFGNPNGFILSSSRSKLLNLRREATDFLAELSVFTSNFFHKLGGDWGATDWAFAV